VTDSHSARADTTKEETETSQEESNGVLPPVDFIDFILFILFLLAFAAALIIFDPLQRIMLLFGQNAHELVMRGLNRTLVATLSILRIDLRITRHSVLEPGKPYIILSNHQAIFDIPILYKVFITHVPRFIAKKELSRGIPSVSFNLRNGLNAIIDRSDPKQAMPVIKQLGTNMAERKFATIVFPENTKSSNKCAVQSSHD